MPPSDPKKARLTEAEWRKRMILAARKVQQATQTFAEDVSAIRDVRPGIERLEKALQASHQKLEKLETRLLEEVLRRLEVRQGRAAATEAEKALLELRPQLQARTAECERLVAEISRMARTLEQRERDQQGLAELAASKDALLTRLQAEQAEAHQRIAQLESELASVDAERERQLEAYAGALEVEKAELLERVKEAELGRSEADARHQQELAHFADHTQARVKKLEDELLKKRRGIKALTEENIQLQTELSELRRQLEHEHEEGVTPTGVDWKRGGHDVPDPLHDTPPSSLPTSPYPDDVPDFEG